MMFKKTLSALVGLACFASAAVAGPRASHDPKHATAEGIAEAHRIASKGSLTTQEVADIASALGNSQYTVLWEDSGLRHVEFGDGLIRIGDGAGVPYAPGERLPRGVYWNYSTEPVWLGAGDGRLEVEIPANGLVVIGQALNDSLEPVIAASGQCVTCDTGFYACCCRNNGGSSKTCHCIPNGQPSDCAGGRPCNGGGPGSTGCNFPDAAIVAIQTLEDFAPEGVAP